jgi:ferredoxin-NADP reductase
MTPTNEFRGDVLEKQRLSPKVYHLVLGKLSPGPMTFHAGQFIQFIIAPRVLRQFSMCSVPSQTAELEFCVDISPGGQGSRFVEFLQVGSTVVFRGPFGVFTVPEGERRTIEFVATGAGIAPIRSMLRDLLERRPEIHARLLFGNRSQEHLLYHDELLTLAREHSRFTYVPALSQPAPDWTGERGRVTEILDRGNDLLGRPYYLCGSPQMVDDTRKILAAKGVPERDVHFEKFY